MEGGRIRSRSAKPYLAGQGSDPEGKNRLKNRLRIRLRISLRFPILEKVQKYVV